LQQESPTPVQSFGFAFLDNLKKFDVLPWLFINAFAESDSVSFLIICKGARMFPNQVSSQM